MREFSPYRLIKPWWLASVLILSVLEVGVSPVMVKDALAFPGRVQEYTVFLHRGDSSLPYHKQVKLRESRGDGYIDYFAYNPYGGPVAFQIDFKAHENVISEPSLPLVVIIPGQSEAFVARLTAQNPYQSWSFNVTYTFYPGDPASQPDGTLYQPPVGPGSRFPVTQAFNGEYSHQKPYTRFAVDIGMPEGTPVYAARDGVVMDVVDDEISGGEDSYYLDDANIVSIAHADGTIAVYAHLQWRSANVSIGDKVKVGDLIARSGSTGFVSGPHLHFVVVKNEGQKLVSIPFEFELNGKAVAPVEDLWLVR